MYFVRIIHESRIPADLLPASHWGVGIRFSGFFQRPNFEVQEFLHFFVPTGGAREKILLKLLVESLRL
jgi:hypothetical protein